MAGYVIAAALGPVSVFIRAGRRGRDLWYGSRFLSEVTRIAAVSLRDQLPEASLIIPQPERLEDAPFVSSHQGPTISNKIFLVAEGAQSTAVEKALKAAEVKCRTFLEGEIRGLLGDPRLRDLLCRDDVLRQEEAMKAGDFLEFYGAWAPFETPQDRPQAVKRVLTLLDGRKASRLFPAPSFTRPGVAKSYLDPGRDSVLYEPDPGERPDAARFLDVVKAGAYIRPGERLDAISVARRRACFRSGDAEIDTLPFPSLARVALDPWLAGARRALPDRIEEVRRELRSLHESKIQGQALFLITSPVRDPGKTTRDDFGYDPELLLENGLTTLRRACAEDRPGRLPVLPDPPGRQLPLLADEAGKGKNAGAAFEKARDTLDQVRDAIVKLHQELGVPIPYIAVLEADGDGVGQLLKDALCSDLSKATALAKQLYDFSDGAWSAIEDHQGCAWFVGGDELSAYFPVDRVLDAANALQERFAACGAGTSLSLGVAIGHVKDDLRSLRHLAGEALERAKTMRRTSTDAFTKSHIVVIESPRGGDSRESGGETSAFVKQVTHLAGLLSDSSGQPPVQGPLAAPPPPAGAPKSQSLSLSFAHGLLALADQLADAAAADGGTAGVGLAASESIQRVRRSGSRLDPAVEDHLKNLKSWGDVRRLANSMLLAERIQRIAAQRQEGHA